jgi:hypothetical protein
MTGHQDLGLGQDTPEVAEANQCKKDCCDAKRYPL